jgi:tryptophanyl-tRNA synthetase
MAQNLITALEPVREKRAYYEQRAEVVDAIIREGNNRARNVAVQTMEEVRAVVKV